MTSKFVVNSMRDLELLASIYGVYKGMLLVTCGETGTLIELVDGSFRELMDHFELKFPAIIVTKFRGSDSIKGVALKIRKDAVTGYEREDVVLKWTKFIDAKVHSEMCYNNDDVCLNFIPPKTCLKSIDELFLACRLSLYVTHVLPTQNGIYALNAKCINIPWIPLLVSTSVLGLQFDIHNGFISYFNDPNDNLGDLNEHFLRWKDDGFDRPLSSILYRICGAFR